MGHPNPIKLSTLLLLVVSAYSYPQYSEKSFYFGSTGSLFNIAKDMINSFSNFLKETGNKQISVETTQDKDGIDFNPEESGEYFQGDIIIPYAGLKPRNGLKPVQFRWPNAVIPYIISPGFNAQQLKIIREAMNEFHRTTCIKFKPYTNSDKDYINIKSNQKGCWSNVGRIGGKQNVNLEVPGCVNLKGTVIHELMHTVGFYHEQSRSDRDNYVDIQWQNILPNQKHNFDKYNTTEVDAFGVGYDYGSIMHYSATAFSKSSNLPTIVPRSKRNITLGQRKGLSYLDMVKIRGMYSCFNQKWKIG